MKVYEIILTESEARIQHIADTMGQKILAAAKKDSSAKVASNTEPVKLVQKIAKADPAQGKSLQWLTRMYANQQYRMEDLNIISQALETFYANINKITNKDLNGYSSVSQFYDVVERASASQQETKRQVDVPDGAALVVDDPKLKVFRTDTYEANCALGKGTRWCTTDAKSSEPFETYSAQGSLYILFVNLKGKERKFQFHVPSNQYMDEKDREITKDIIAELSKIPAYTNFLNFLIKENYAKYFKK
jgi:hypothetical protein